MVRSTDPLAPTWIRRNLRGVFFDRTGVGMRHLLLALSAIASASTTAAQTPATRQTQPVVPPAGTPSTTSPTPASATAIGYSLPSSSVKVVVGFTLVSCTGRFAAKADVTFVPVVGPSPYAQHRFRLDGRDLSSFWKNRKITLETFPNGTIKSLNGALSDQTGSIISSVIKLVTGFVASDGEQAVGLAGQCNQATLSAMSRVAALGSRIGTLRTQLSGLPPSQIEAAKLTIDTLAEEAARLQTADLRIEFPSELVLEREITGGTLRWRRSDFAKWLINAPSSSQAEAPVRDLAIGLCIAPETPGRAPPTCDGKAVDAADILARSAGKAPPAVACPEDPDCRTTIVLREPRRATITAISLAGGLAGKPKDASIKTADLTISQWGDLSFLPLRVGFGKSVNFAMGFDENGHKVSQTWDATARGTSLLGAASSITDAAVGAYRTIDGEHLAEQKAEVDRLNTLKAYNQAKHCEAVLAAGGFTCP